MKNFISFFIFALLFLFGKVVGAQTLKNDFKNYDAAGLEFNYPADWILTDKSSDENQHFLISKEKSSALIIVVSPRKPISSQEEFFSVQSETTKSYTKTIAKTLNLPDASSEDLSCADISGKSFVGQKFRGKYNNDATQGEIYPFIMGRRFVTLVYLRSDKDAPESDSVWKEITRSLKIDAQNAAALGDPLNVSYSLVGILNQKAKSLAQPIYPSAARARGESGTVIVRVLVDINGKVTEATTVFGLKSLQQVSEDAAKASKFAPIKLCGEPVRVSGIIIYNFTR